MNKINYYHSLIFFNLCIFLSAFEFLRNNDPLIFCLFLILSMGISHGALDHLKGTKFITIGPPHYFMFHIYLSDYL